MRNGFIVAKSRSSYVSFFFGETASRKYIKTFFAIVSLLQYFALGATEVCLTLTERMKSGKLSSC